ncbi:type IV secretory system conjugative DNA transfer family protein [Deinococcus cellulosilyticus]|uniref:TraD/TraG TraM recognition site domain-containing protein n=1 Tax=Deinococcus cellulosilyticus (strain DSM 18568 / NBRC 106333 / KACC 11606 / 5516J-15) TaxID=1223518 RepID=A0A511NAV0_DEIC1|nr:type IV secretory system conjugative DNA transfer family protein [Deinococcus cellulosilyticus]GEM49912.1 hypothetical protein DC3_55470 [Deinococcus cellulosilyticus NBRC 106333 = KACC 11606]
MIVRYPLFMLKMLLIYASVALIFYNLLFVGNTAVYFGAAAFALAVLLFFNGKDAFYKPPYNAHWATEQEIKELFVENRKGNEILLGFAYNKMIALRPGVAGRKEVGHLLVVGPSRSGKGLNIFANLLNWKGSMIVVDIKGEFYQTTAGYRKEVMGQDVYVLNPSTGTYTNQYDPFMDRETDEQLLASCTALLNPQADGSNSAFAMRATFALFAIVKTAKLLNKPVLPFVRDSLNLGIKECMTTIYSATKNKSVRGFVRLFLGEAPHKYNWESYGSDKFLNNAWMNLITKMVYLFGNGILTMTGGQDFRAADLVEKKSSLYLVFRESDLKYTVNSFSVVILSIVESIIRNYDLHPEKKFEPILLVFDEAGRITVPELPQLTATVAGRGMITAIYIQSMSQLETLYGAAGMETVQSNTHTKIFFTPKDEGTAKYMSAVSGKFMVEDSRQSEGNDSSSDSLGLTAKELITVESARTLPGGRVIVQSNEFPLIAGYRMEPFVLPEWEKAKKYPPPAVGTQSQATDEDEDEGLEGLPLAPTMGTEAPPVSPVVHKDTEGLQDEISSFMKRAAGGVLSAPDFDDE